MQTDSVFKDGDAKDRKTKPAEPPLHIYIYIFTYIKRATIVKQEIVKRRVRING